MASTKVTEEVPLIRKADLENHNKDGGLWVVIHNKVYDIQDFKAQAPCGNDLLLEYAGEYTCYHGIIQIHCPSV